MASTPASPAARRRLANAVRRILLVFRRRTRHNSALPDPPNYPPELVPEMSAALERLKSEIDPLAEKGLLDDGHFGSFDPTIERWVDHWKGDLQAKHRAHQARLEQTERDLTSATSRLQREIQRAEERVVALGKEISMLRREESEPPEEADEPQTANNGQRRWPVVYKAPRVTANEPIEETS